jgi:hypothetical protein
MAIEGLGQRALLSLPSRFALLQLPQNWGYFPTGSPFWLAVNVSFNIILGGGIYLALVVVFPRIANYVAPYWNPGANKGKGAWVPPGNLYTWRGIFKLGVWVLWVFIKVVVFVVGMIGTLLTLLLSVGLEAPTSLQAIVFDIIYARANGQPNGAHIPSYLILVVFGFVVCYKFQWRPFKTMESLMGDPFQGIAAAGFLGAMHEILWIGFYYAGYYQYLSWTDFPEVMRDVSFVGLLLLLLATFWKYPKRKFPLRIFKWPVVLYSAYLVAWFFLPPLLFGFHVFPITTINNPQFGTGLYQQTPWWGNPWVNVMEVGSWLLLGFSFIFAVVRYRRAA